MTHNPNKVSGAVTENKLIARYRPSDININKLMHAPVSYWAMQGAKVLGWLLGLFKQSWNVWEVDLNQFAKEVEKNQLKEWDTEFKAQMFLDAVEEWTDYDKFIQVSDAKISLKEEAIVYLIESFGTPSLINQSRAVLGWLAKIFQGRFKWWLPFLNSQS